MGTQPANEALERLIQGNKRFRNDRARGPGQIGSRREELIEGQHPSAITLSCSDSRVPPEIIFDTGPGDLFVVRVAGNVANPSSIASIEYAVSNLGTKLIVVMAHQNCGAIGAAMAGGDAGKNLNLLVSYIKPVLDPAEKDVNLIARRNARLSAQRLVSESEIIRAATENDEVRIVTAFFHFTDGKVEFD